MNKKTILNNAIDLLNGVELSEIENIQISHTQNADGSEVLSIEVSYPPKNFDEIAGDALRSVLGKTSRDELNEGIATLAEIARGAGVSTEELYFKPEVSI